MNARVLPPPVGFSPWERVKRLLCDEVWNIGVVDQSVADIARHGMLRAPEWLPPPPTGTMLADPACRANPDGGFTIFAEQLDYRKRRIGEIWSADVPSEAAFPSARFAPFIVRPYHMSYPFPLQDGTGRRLLTAETWNAGSALLWQADDVPKEVGAVMPGRQAVDPTLWHDGDRWWLFCTFQDESPNGMLHLFDAPDVQGPWRAHPRNPVQTGLGCSRPAGPLFRMDDVLVRPAQDCSRTYGGAIVLQAVVRMDAEAYEERPLRRLDPSPGPYGAGLHTICSAGSRTLIDGKRWRMDPLGSYAKLRRAVVKRLPRRGMPARPAARSALT